MFVLVGYNFGDQKETEFLGSGNMPKKQDTHAQVCRGSGVLGHAPRKALKVKKIRKGAGKNKPLKAAVQAQWHRRRALAALAALADRRRLGRL